MSVAMARRFGKLEMFGIELLVLEAMSWEVNLQCMSEVRGQRSGVRGRGSGELRRAPQSLATFGYMESGGIGLQRHCGELIRRS